VPIMPAKTPSVIKGHYLFGFWPVSLAPRLDEHLANESNRSLRHWIAVCGAKQVPCETEFHNINTYDALLLYQAAQIRVPLCVGQTACSEALPATA
jgi:molybdopterin-guanine dinucleotide biosynthesis protein A